MTARRAMLLVHRWSGLLAALFLLLAAGTGCILVFRGELDRVLNPELFAAPPGPPLPGPDLATRLQFAHPDWELRSFPVRAEARRAFRVEIAPVTVVVRGRATRDAEEVFLNPRTGTVIGTRADRLGLDRPHLVDTLLALHYGLVAGRAGEWVMEAVAVPWLAMTVLGVAITWPRRSPRLRHWMPRWSASRAGLRARPLLELHRAAGLWLAMPMLVLAATSVAFNVYHDWFVPALERLSPPRPGAPPDGPSPPVRPGDPAPIGFAAALVAAERFAVTHTPSLRPASMGDGGAAGYQIRFSPGGTSLDEEAGPVTYDIGRTDGRLVWIDRPSIDGWGRVTERAVYSLHSGQVFGWSTRILVFVLGLATIGFVVTGVPPWWKRARNKRAHNP